LREAVKLQQKWTTINRCAKSFMLQS
jgi:hypothetical protein